MIFLSSDYHFGHDREFIWQARGFQSVEEMNQQIVERHNLLVGPSDKVYILGDLCLGGGGDEALSANKKLIESLNGHLYIIFGNHDTPNRIKMYSDCKNVDGICGWSTVLDYRKYHFYLSHFPTMTANLEKESLKQCLLNLYGHTHQKSNFYQDIPMVYHVGVDSHDCFPVSLDVIIDEIKAKANECLAQL
jgi:calcineurin-like phosphoesterase family protein